VNAVNCPKCATPLPDSVLKGPRRAIVRCDACKTELLWFEGKAVVKSTPTRSPAPGVPVVKAGSETSGKTMTMATAQAPKAQAVKSTVLGMPAAPYSSKPATQAPRRPTPRPSPSPSPVQKAPIVTVGKPAEARKDPSIGSFPLPQAAPQRPQPAAKSNIVSKVQTDIPAAPGPTVDPTGWFDEKGKAKSEPSGKIPTLGAKPAAKTETKSVHKSQAKEEPAPLPPAPGEAAKLKPLDIKPVMPEPRSDSVVDDLPSSSAPRANMVGADIPGAELATEVLDTSEAIEVTAEVTAEVTSEQTAEKTHELPPVAPVTAPPPVVEPNLAALASAAMEPPAPAPAAASEPAAPPAPSYQLAPTIDGTDRTMLAAVGISRRKLAVAGAAVVVVACIGVVMLSRGGKAQTKVAPVAADTPRPVTAGAAPFVPAPVAEAPKPAVAPKRAAPPPSERPPEPALATTHRASGETPSETPRASSGHSRHKVVLEYDPKPSQQQTPEMGPAPAGADPKLLERARDSYHRGNWSLFVGNSNGAVDAYRDTIKIYPGYIAGYRGLGLAYEELGKKKEALDALRNYVKTVPSARDVPLIKKRIERLERSLEDDKD
jgi:hypothetical protein